MSKFFAVLSATVCTSCLFADGMGESFQPSQEVSFSVPASEPQAVEAEVAPAALPVVKTAAAPVPAKVVEVPVSAFTGKVKGKKVRLRVKADLDSPVVRELSKNELLTVVAEKGDFWAVQAPAGTKAYVFRSFVLDNVIEGNRVNIRLEPNTEAPIISHLNAGDKIQGTICASNNKWLEISAPANTRFYVSKDYLENIGGPEVKAQADKRRVNVEQLVEAAALLGKAELHKPYHEIDIERITQSYKTVINEYTDFPEHVEKAKELLASLQEAYVQKRLAQADAKLAIATAQEHSDESDNLQTSNSTLASALVNDKMKMWEPVEEALYLSWSQANDDRNQEQFYEEQKLAAATITGIVEAYTAPVKNKPGDFIIRDKDMPVAYVYSTRVNLQNMIGKKVTLLGCPRSNNNFAFPAYFVIAAE
ncbi:MAG: hypothetical protein HYX48_06890 [Chlamydiales bacterium]|nr:hypothetical protein [Chlamydiales bacterium]